MEALLKEIVDTIHDKPTYGIAVKDNSNGNWILNFSTLSDLKNRGLESVGLYLNELSKKYEDITLYLKRPNGGSTKYVEGKRVRLKRENLTNPIAANRTERVAPDESGATASVYQQQQATTPMNNQNFQFPQMNGVAMGFTDLAKMYSAQEQKAILEVALNKAETELAAERGKVEKLKEDLRQKEFDVYKLKNEAQNKASAIEKAAMYSPLLEKGLEALSGLLPKPVPALNGTDQKQYSPSKTRIIDIVKNDQFPEHYAHLFVDLLIMAENDAFCNQLVELANQENQKKK